MNNQYYLLRASDRVCLGCFSRYLDLLDWAYEACESQGANKLWFESSFEARRAFFKRFAHNANDLRILMTLSSVQFGSALARPDYWIVDQFGRTINSKDLQDDLREHVHNPRWRDAYPPRWPKWAAERSRLERYVFRVDPVPGTGKARHGYYWRSIAHAPEKRAWVDYEEQMSEAGFTCRRRRSAKAIPDNREDIPRSYERGWKTATKKKSQWM